jgi:hypothetical protein
METEAIFVISDDSDPEDSVSTRRKADERDPLEGKRILRNKKPKVRKLQFFFFFPGVFVVLLSFFYCF